MKADSNLSMLRSRYDKLVSYAETLGLQMLATLWNERAETLFSTPRVQILVIGEFNHGKSSLINALVGKPLLASGIIPTTQVETHVHLGEEAQGTPRIEVTDATGHVTTLPWEAWDARRLQTQAQRIDLWVDDARFGPSCVLIDTPGLNEVTELREVFLADQISRADFVLFVIDGGQALTRSEERLIAHYLTPLDPNRRAVVINKCDRLTPDEWLDVCAYVEAALWPILGYVPLYMVSAIRPEIGDMQDLNTLIADTVKTRRASAIDCAVRQAISEMVGILLGAGQFLHVIEALDAASLRAMLHHDDSRHPILRASLAACLDDASTRLREVRTQAQRQILDFTHGFLQAIPREIDKAMPEDVEDFLEGFILAEFLDFVVNLRLDYGRQLAEIALSVMNKLIEETLPKMPSRAKVTFAQGVFMPAVSELVHGGLSGKTVASFGFSTPTSFWLGIPVLSTLLQKRVERQVSERAKVLAAQVIEAIGKEIGAAVERDLSRQQSIFEAIFRACGLRWQALFSDMARTVQANRKAGEPMPDPGTLLDDILMCDAAHCPSGDAECCTSIHHDRKDICE
ncbi:MAG: dynamin family protein [Proteobacteria bacterium]|nr:dynamin family protein [Pseudomonadota bacterium]